MAYTIAEAREDVLAALARAADELGLALAYLTEAYEQVDEHSGDSLEEQLFRPVQLAAGRAQRALAGFAGRHRLEAGVPEPQTAGLPSQGAAGFVGRAAEAAAEADRVLAELQDSMLPVEAGDEELRADLRAIREPLDGVPERARRFLSGLGR